MTETTTTSAEKPKHITQPLTLEDFRPGVMKPESYSSSDISKVFIEHLRRTDLTDIKLRGLKKYKYQTWNWGNEHNISDIKKMFEIFNKVYFNGVLTGHCFLETAWVHGFYSYLLRKGVGRDTRYKRDRTTAHIVVPNSVPHAYGPYSDLSFQLSNLVEEMYLILFSLFMCACERGCKLEFVARPDFQALTTHILEAQWELKKAARRDDLIGIDLDICKGDGWWLKWHQTTEDNGRIWGLGSGRERYLAGNACIAEEYKEML